MNYLDYDKALEKLRAEINNTSVAIMDKQLNSGIIRDTYTVLPLMFLFIIPLLFSALLFRLGTGFFFGFASFLHFIVQMMMNKLKKDQLRLAFTNSKIKNVSEQILEQKIKNKLDVKWLKMKKTILSEIYMELVVLKNSDKLKSNENLSNKDKKRVTLLKDTIDNNMQDIERLYREYILEQEKNDFLFLNNTDDAEYKLGALALLYLFLGILSIFPNVFSSLVAIIGLGTLSLNVVLGGTIKKQFTMKKIYKRLKQDLTDINSIVPRESNEIAFEQMNSIASLEKRIVSDALQLFKEQNNLIKVEEAETPVVDNTNNLVSQQTENYNYDCPGQELIDDGRQLTKMRKHRY